jgi:hypothetical protein
MRIMGTIKYTPPKIIALKMLKVRYRSASEAHLKLMKMAIKTRRLVKARSTNVALNLNRDNSRLIRLVDLGYLNLLGGLISAAT